MKDPGLAFPVPESADRSVASPAEAGGQSQATASLWEGVIKQMKPEADIEMMSNNGPQQAPAGLPSGNAFQQNAQ